MVENIFSYCVYCVLCIVYAKYEYKCRIYRSVHTHTYINLLRYCDTAIILCFMVTRGPRTLTVLNITSNTNIIIYIILD